MKAYWIYILCSKKDGALYVGVTNNLFRRIYEHKNQLISGFTERYNVSKLVYVEKYANIDSALKREKNLKSWNRAWKIQLIEKNNPEWQEILLEE